VSSGSLITRRDFVAVAAASTVSVAANQATAAKSAAPPVIDTHLHCFAKPGDKRFPYHQRAPYRPTTGASPEHLLHCMAGAGVDHAIVVHPEPYQDDHRFLDHCLQVGGKKLKGTCLFFGDRPGSILKMPTLVKQHPGRIVAARIHAFRKDRIPDFSKPGVGQVWKMAAELGLAVQLHFEPKYARGFETFIREYPKTTVVIDHLGRPLQSTRAEHDLVFRWARYKNTIIKVSSLPAEDATTTRPIGPIIRRLVDAYGPSRSIYGGGFNGSATPGSYRAYRQRVAGYLGKLSKQDLGLVLGGTAARVFGF
jgi:predicted TIM-barrel fold metal-dependent hydrolase